MMPEMGFPGNRLWDEVHMQEVSGEDHWNRHLCKGGERGGYQHEERGGRDAGHLRPSPWGVLGAPTASRVVLQKTEVARPL